MLFEETRAIRAFVGRIDDGQDVVEALTLICEANDLSAVDVRVSGVLRDVELVRFDAARREYVTTLKDAGPFEVVVLSGHFALLGGQPVTRVNAMLAAQGPAGQQLIFGQLRHGYAVDCEFVLETHPDITITRRVDAATGRFPISAVERPVAPAAVATAAPVSAPAPPAPAPQVRERREPEVISEPMRTSAGTDKSEMSWADAIEASEDIKPATQREKRPIPRAQGRSAEEIYADLEDEPVLKPGDLLNHPKLGECRVIKVEDEEYAHIRLSRGQIRKLALEVIELIYEGERDGKNVFKVRIRK